jgi:TolA-binding protein
MNKNKFKIATLFSAGAMVVSGCLTTRAELRDAEGRSEGRNESRSEPRKIQVDPVQERAANTSAKLDEMESQFRNINGRLDVVENRIGQLDALKSDQQSTDQNRQGDMGRQMKAYEEALGKMETQLAALGEEVRSMKTRKEVAAAAAPGHAKDGVARAEELFSKKEFKQAIVEFENYRKAFPKGKGYASATLKIGMAFSELNMKDEAKAFYQEVVTKFPSSAEAKKASQRLKAMK